VNRLIILWCVRGVQMLLMYNGSSI